MTEVVNLALKTIRRLLFHFKIFEEVEVSELRRFLFAPRRTNGGGGRGGSSVGSLSPEVLDGNLNAGGGIEFFFKLTGHSPSLSERRL